jgi:hypothetical protein
LGNARDTNFFLKEVYMKTFRRSFLVFFLCFAAGAGLAAQVIQSGSLDGLDRETGRIAALVVQKINSLPEAALLTVDARLFTFSDLPLGRYWQRALLQGLINNPERAFKIPAIVTGASGTRPRLTLDGEIIEVGNVVRVYTWLIDNQEAAVISGWQSDFENSDFIAGLVQSPDTSSSGVRRDNREPDSRENPAAMNIGTPAQRTIHSGDSDYFSVSSVRRSLVTIDVDGDFDSRLELFDSQGALIDENDDYGSGYNPHIEFLAEADTPYIIRVFGYSDNTGTYTIRTAASEFNEAEMEPNNSRGSAFAVEPNSALTGVFDSGTDAEWFSVRIPQEGGLLRVYTAGSRDTILKLWDRNELLAEDDDGGDGYNARIASVLVAGTYYIELTELNGSQGIYTLHVELSEILGADQYENDNTFSRAKTLEIGEVQRRTFTGGNDMDWVRFTVTARGRYGIRARGENNLRLDTYIELYNDSEDLIDDDDDGGENYDSYLNIELEPGTYYLKVSTLDDEPPADYYLLSVELLR